MLQEGPPDIPQEFCLQVSAKAHPDKGGSTADFQRLTAARDAWLQEAFPQGAQQSSQGSASSRARGAGKGGSKGSGGSDAGSRARPSELVLVQSQKDENNYRIRGEAILLTYQSWPGEAALAARTWEAFLVWVRACLAKWLVKRWTATMETNEDGRVHIHLMLQFRTIVDRLATGFIYQGTRPNVSTNDYCGEGYCKKKMQQSIDRGTFYAWAEKIGTLYMACNYEPCWTQAKDKYQVLGAGAW